MWGYFWPFYIITSVICYNKRVFDVTNLFVEIVIIKAGENKSIACPGVTEHSLVQELEWLSLTHHLKLVEYMSDSTTVWTNQHRIFLIQDSFGLSFHPAMAEDSGDYICLVNSRPKPDALVRLIVQDVPDPPGRPLIMSFTSRSVNLSWAPTQDTHYSLVTHYIIHTRVGEDGDWTATEGILTPTNETNYHVMGLQPYTVYSFRVFAVNGMGASGPSKESYYMVTLRESPTGKPTITTAHNTSATALFISWRPPHHETIHGEFLGYRISYRPRDHGEEAMRDIYIRDPSAESYIIDRLETYTQYLVSLQVFNPEGAGPKTTVLVMTDEGVPSKPLNVSVLGVTSNSVYLSWFEPLHANGPIDGYRIYYIHSNLTEVQSYRLHGGGSSHVLYNLTNLKPNTEYDIRVNAFTGKNEGEQSDSIINKTDIGGPSPPHILNLTCQAQDVIYLQWQRPLEFYNSIDFYYIYVYTVGALIYDNISLPASKEHLQTSYAIKNVTMDMLYQIQVSAASYSHYSNKVIEGLPSEPKEVLVQSNCDKIQQFMRHTTTELSAGMIAGVGCAAFAFLLGILAFVVWRKCFHATYYYLDDVPCSVPTNSLDWNTTSDPSGDYKGAIPVDMFARHVAELHADGDIGFSKEYEAIQTNNDEYSSEHSQHTDNKTKNRYTNIIAYDHSRVQLLQMTGQKKNIDYINANYIDGFQWSKAYIGTQGPLPSTFDCFWRMVWEQRVTIIVMITNLVERGRRKCDMYWPKEGIETYGVIQVKLVKEDVMATYTVRTLQIRHLRIKKKKAAMAEKIVYQYHYTNWPDHGTPDHPLPVLHFVKKSASANPPDSGPIIVHCSAGVGRTGTYIVLDAMLKQIRTRNEVNIFGFLRHIRSQRNFLVQTEEQYIFIHDALLEAIDSGETNIKREQISKYVQALQSNNIEEKGEQWKPLEYQFKLVTSFQCKDFNLISANKVINKPKNRSDIVSVESSRVHLTPKPGEDGSDYINATWIQGYNSLREFIITQHPLKETIKDFWQMVWDHNAQTIIMLSIIDNEDFEIFWPMDQEIIESDNYKIRLSSERTESMYVTRDFVMQSVQDDYELHVRMVHWTNWPHHCVYISELFQLPNMVQETQLGYQNGPVVVVDRFGCAEAATYCCLTTLKKQLAYENHADIYMYAKLYHNKRPGVWSCSDNYLRLHLAIQSICNQAEEISDWYAMANGTINGSLSNDCLRVPPEGMEAMGTGLTVA